MKSKKIFTIPSLILLGALIMLMTILLQHQPAVPPGEYHYSTILRNHYNWLSITLQMVAGLLSGYYLRLNAFLIGICLMAIFPLTAIWEATIYRGSHNLIPAELIMYFLYALPAVGASAAGNLLKRKKQQ